MNIIGQIHNCENITAELRPLPKNKTRVLKLTVTSKVSGMKDGRCTNLTTTQTLDLFDIPVEIANALLDALAEKKPEAA